MMCARLHSGHRWEADRRVLEAAGQALSWEVYRDPRFAALLRQFSEHAVFTAEAAELDPLLDRQAVDATTAIEVRLLHPVGYTVGLAGDQPYGAFEVFIAAVSRVPRYC